MILEKIGYNYNDITIVPSVISNIKTRSEINPFTKDDMLPIFASPMDSIVSVENCDRYIENNITPVIPRTQNIELKTRVEMMFKGYWVAMSLDEFRKTLVDVDDEKGEQLKHTKLHVCIDIANGHMKQLYDACKEAKHKSFKYHYTVEIMTGNIANPETYEYITLQLTNACECVIDYIRCGIGSGAGCITSSNTGIHYPIATLINEIYKIKKQHPEYAPKIIADGGIRNYSDVIKALALGADYVMIGSLFASCVEACGTKFAICDDGSYMEIEDYETLEQMMNNKTYDVVTEFYGMASAKGQEAMNGEKTKTSEGIVKYIPVTTSLKKWSTNMRDYMRTAMSYCNSFSLRQFIGRVDCIINSVSEIQSVNK